MAPRFQQASRNDIGTAARASRVLVMITGRVITASVQEAASSERPMPANSTKAPTPNRACTMLGTPGQIHHGQIDDPREPVVAGVFVQVDAGQDADRGGHQQRDQHQEEGADQRRPDAAGGHVILRILPDEGQRQRRPGLERAGSRGWRPPARPAPASSPGTRTGRSSPSPSSAAPARRGGEDFPVGKTAALARLSRSCHCEFP